MGTRKNLQVILENLLGSKNVYFQPPESAKMQYPCIVYSRNKATTKFSNNNPYSINMAYQIIVIDKNPDSDIPGKIAKLPMCVFDRHYIVDNLNHDSYILYY
jgi:hypothetical protein